MANINKICLGDNTLSKYFQARKDDLDPFSNSYYEYFILKSSYHSICSATTHPSIHTGMQA